MFLMSSMIHCIVKKKSQNDVYHSAGRYYFADEATVILTTEHFHRAWENNNNPAVWTFNPTNNYKIRFHFTDFYCYNNNNYCYVRIGNGLVSDQSRLLSHTGSDLPRDVTSTSNTAWLKVYLEPYLLRIMCIVEIIPYGTGRKWVSLRVT